MPAYMVFIREKTLDQSELEAYWEKVVGTLDGRPIKSLATIPSSRACPPA